MVRIDLHTHSTASDGTQSPADLIAEAAAVGLDVVAITDHDTTAGWDEAAAAARRHGPALVRGIEISCVSPAGVSIHLLGYLHDPTYAPLLAELVEARESRSGRARRIVEALAADTPLTWADVERQVSPGATVGRPHIADAMVARDIVPDRTAAFEDYLYDGSPYYVSHYAIPATRAVELVREAGGVPVMAHPFAQKRGRIVGDDVVAAMADAGLAGLEAHHLDHTPEQAARAVGLAADLGLFVTGSSDYHGSGKPNRLGDRTTDPAVFEQIVDAARGAQVIRPE